MTETRPNVWMPLYIGDYLRDTSRLTTEQHGAYLLLMFDYWSSTQPLPDDDAQLALITRLSPEKWHQLRPSLARFFQIVDGVWRHKRIDQELAKAQAITDARREGGKKGATRRWARNSNGSANNSPTNSVIAKPLGEPQLSQWPMHTQPQSPSQPQNSSLRSQSAREVDEAFEEWWKEYPNKVGKRAAETAYRAALKRASAIDLLEGLRRYATTKPADRQWCNPSTWLNQDRWLDEPQKVADAKNGSRSSQRRNAPGTALIEGFARAAARRARDSGDDQPPAQPLLDRG